MAISVARVHLAMAHAALPGLLAAPPRCTMLPLLPLPVPPCAIILPNNSPPRPSRADAAGRWDAHKIKPPGNPAASSSSSSSSGSQRSLGHNKKVVTRTSLASSSRANSEERWDAHKRPASPASSSSSSSLASTSYNKTKTCQFSRRPNGGREASSAAERWDGHKKPRVPPPVGELDDGASSTGSNDVELGMLPRQSLPWSLYAASGFMTSPDPSMLPKPSFMIHVA